MKSYYYLPQLGITFSTFSAAIYSFSQTSLYRNLGTILLSLPRYGYIIFLPGLLVLIIYLLMFRKWKNLLVIHVLSVLFYLPSALSFSQIDLLLRIGANIENYLSIEATLAIGVLVIIGNLLIYSLNQFKKNGSEMEEKEVSEKRIYEIFSNQSKYLLALIIPSGGIAFFFGLFSLRFRESLSGILSRIPFPHLIVGVGSAITVLLIVIFFASRKSE